MTIRKLNIIVIATVVVLTGAFVGVLLMPGAKELKRRREELAQQMRAVRDEQQRIGNVSEIYAAILEMDHRLADYQQRLPPERQFGEFLQSLSDRLKMAGIDQNMVMQKPEQGLDDSKLPASLKSAHGTGILPVQVSFDSTFNQLFDFLKSVEMMPRLSHVESLSVANDEASPGRVHADITLHTYYRPDPAQPTVRL